jgi:hypothetical protein
MNKATIVFVWGVLAMTASAFEIIHSGNTSPFLQGWTGADANGSQLRIPVPVPHPSVLVGPVSDVEPAWKVHDMSTAGLTTYFYMQGITPSQALTAMEHPWTFSARIRLGQETAPNQFGSVLISFAAGSRRFQLSLSHRPNGDLVARMSRGTVLPLLFAELPGLDASAFHDYELRYDPTTALADLYVDGALAMSGYPGRAIAESFPYIAWGSGQANDTGEGDYAQVRFVAFDDEAPAAAVDCVFAHFGDADPIAKGWLGGIAVGTVISPVSSPPANMLVGPVTNNLEYPAWKVEDMGQASYLYFRPIPQAKVQAALATGWTLSARLNLPEADSVPRAVGISFATGSRRFQMTFGAEEDGDPIMRINQGGTNVQDYIIQDVGPGFHLYEMIFDPCQTSATVYVDGVGVVSNIIGRVSSESPYIAFGSGQNNDTGIGEYNYVQFSFIPIGEDLDGDGMEDRFEQQYFLNAADNLDADLDTDGDGLTNREEGLARTNPNDSSSSLVIPLSSKTYGLVKGDVNADGQIDPRDLTLLLQLAAGVRTPTAYELYAADLDSSSLIDAADAERLVRLLKGERLGNRISLPYTGVGMMYTIECRSGMNDPWQNVFRFVGTGRAQSHVLPDWPHAQRYCRIRVNRVCDHGE